MNFKAWLFYGDSGLETDIHRIETNYASTSIEFPRAEPNDVQERCKQLFNILTGILRVASLCGYCAKLLRKMISRFGGNWCNSFHQKRKAGRFPDLLR